MSGKEFNKEVMKTIIALMTAAFGMVAALSWNEAIKAIFNYYLGSDGTMVGMIVYAVVVTVIVVLITILLARMAAKVNEED